MSAADRVCDICECDIDATTVAPGDRGHEVRRRRRTASLSGTVAAKLETEEHGVVDLTGEYTQHYGEASVGISGGTIECWLLDAVGDDDGRSVRLGDRDRRRANDAIRDAAVDALASLDDHDPDDFDDD